MKPRKPTDPSCPGFPVSGPCPGDPAPRLADDVLPEILSELPELLAPPLAPERGRFATWALEKIENPGLRHLAFLVERVILGKTEFIPGATISEAGQHNFQEEKFRSFFHKLAMTTIEFSSRLIGNQDFLQCFLAICRALKKERVSRKIEYYAVFLESAATDSGHAIPGMAVFEKFLGLLEELDFEDIQVLFILDRYQDNHPRAHPSQPDRNWVDGFFPAFRRAAMNRFRWTERDFDRCFQRLIRHGLVKKAGSGLAGCLESHFFQLKGFIQLQKRLG